MAESYVPFNDNASASRNFHTFQRSNGTVTAEAYVQLTGEPYLAAYTVTASNAPVTTTANSHLLQIMAGASKRVGIRRIEIYQTTAATTLTTAAIAVYQLSSAGTGGTSIGVVANDPADGAAGCTGMTLPTIKGSEGSLIRIGTYRLDSALTTVTQRPELAWDWTRSATKALWIAAGTSNGIAIKQITGVSPAAVYIWVELVESAEGA